MFHLTQVRLTLDSQLHLTPGTGGLKVPSSCTVVIIAGQSVKFNNSPKGHTSFNIVRCVPEQGGGGDGPGGRYHRGPGPHAAGRLPLQAEASAGQGG